VTLDHAAKLSIGHLDFPAAGSYVVFAKAWIENAVGGGLSNVECDLALTSGDFDRGRVGLQHPGMGPVVHGSMALNVVGTVAAGGAADLKCRDLGDGNTRARFVKVSAIRVGALTNTQQL
jgi:hypothetical protein